MKVGIVLENLFFSQSRVVERNSEKVLKVSISTKHFSRYKKTSESIGYVKYVSVVWESGGHQSSQALSTPFLMNRECDAGNQVIVIRIDKLYYIAFNPLFLCNFRGA